ncbi:MAG: hypothetical protein II928_03860 [Paludibacteraceae bacterium]|nr:hypothetical protein [Paludibacteraceae bacterium]MBR0194830.1 hypothetical protein [Paludibacteraceae bacterium]
MSKKKLASPFVYGTFSSLLTWAGQNKKRGFFIVTTRRAPSINRNKMRMYLRSAASYQRSSPPSDAELDARALFKKRHEYVLELFASGKCKNKARAWQIAKKEIKP